MKFIVACIFLFSSSVTFAALPPWSQRAKEIAAVVSDQTTIANFAHLATTKQTDGLISSVEFIPSLGGGAIYRVKSENCYEDVFVKYEEADTVVIGPIAFTIHHTNPVVCN